MGHDIISSVYSYMTIRIHLTSYWGTTWIKLKRERMELQR